MFGGGGGGISQTCLVAKMVQYLLISTGRIFLGLFQNGQVGWFSERPFPKL